LPAASKACNARWPSRRPRPPSPAAPASTGSGPGNFKLTVSGNLDAAIGHQGNVATSSAALQGGTTKFFNGGMAPTNLAVTGSTDIADGLTALFKVDTEFLTSSGANMLPVSGQIAPSSYNGANGNACCSIVLPMWDWVAGMAR
jgi:hypothetical protein